MIETDKSNYGAKCVV